MLTIIELLAALLIPSFLLLDLYWRSRRFVTTRFWRLNAPFVTIAIYFFAGSVANWWSEILGDFHLVNGSVLGTGWGALVGIAVYEFFHYWYHRLAHRWNWLWRAGHQMHHSAESMDAFGAYYLHPFDAFLFTSIASIVFFPLLGLVPEAGVIGALFLSFNAMFQHANISTPRFLGYFIQRPESHTVHHGKEIHRYNYCDLPLWDMAFGTYLNPRRDEIPSECGFYEGASTKVVSMLFGRDVSKQVTRSSDPITATVSAQ